MWEEKTTITLWTDPVERKAPTARRGDAQWPPTRHSPKQTPRHLKRKAVTSCPNHSESQWTSTKHRLNKAGITEKASSFKSLQARCTRYTLVTSPNSLTKRILSSLSNLWRRELIMHMRCLLKDKINLLNTTTRRLINMILQLQLHSVEVKTVSKLSQLMSFLRVFLAHVSF